MATIATTLDSSNNPIIFSIGPGGVVQDNRQVPTNIAADPYRSNGLETLGGITATSIAAYQLPNQTPIVIATTGPESYVYEDQYNSGGWSGWIQASQFVARSIIAVGATNGVGPAIFAIGADDNVYENLYSSSYSNSDYQLLPGLAATSLAAIYDSGNTFRVFALIGPESYVYQDTTTVSDGTITSSGWSPLSTFSNFVASSISVANGPSSPVQGVTAPNYLIVFATGAGDGNLYEDGLVLDTQTGLRPDRGFGMISRQPYDPSVYPVPSPVLPFVASTATDCGEYLTVFATTSDGDVYENQFLLTGLNDEGGEYWVGWQALHVLADDDQTMIPLLATDIASFVPAYNGGVEVVTNNSTFTPQVAVAPSHVALAFPGYTPVADAFSYATTIASTAYHPIVTTSGVNGRPVVFTIGSDGTVYDSQDLATGTGVTTTQDPYSALTPLPGIAATSLAATTEPGGIALFALTGSTSEVFDNQYRPTGTGDSYAWTGWVPTGMAGVSEIAAATGGDSASNGPMIFADNYTGTFFATGTAPASPSGSYTFGSFTTLPGLIPTTLSAVSTNTGIELAATIGAVGLPYPDNGAASYPYADFDTAGVWSGWQQAGDYVMSSALATTSATGGPAIAGISPLGYQAVSTYGSSGWGAYLPLGFSPFDAPVTTDGTASLEGFGAVALPNQSGVTYFDLIQAFNPDASSYDGVTTTTMLADGSNSPPDSEGSKTGNSLAVVPNELQPTYYLVGTDGILYVNQAVPDGPNYSYLGYVSLGSIPS